MAEMSMSLAIVNVNSGLPHMIAAFTSTLVISAYCHLCY